MGWDIRNNKKLTGDSEQKKKENKNRAPGRGVVLQRLTHETWCGMLEKLEEKKKSNMAPEQSVKNSSQVEGRDGAYNDVLDHK